MEPGLGRRLTGVFHPDQLTIVTPWELGDVSGQRDHGGGRLCLGDYLASHLGLFRRTQVHYLAGKAAWQSALRPSMVRFGRAVRHHPGLLFTRRTMHLFRLWLSGLCRTVGSIRDGE